MKSLKTFFCFLFKCDWVQETVVDVQYASLKIISKSLIYVRRSVGVVRSRTQAMEFSF
jgi:hypothetical protein